MEEGRAIRMGRLFNRDSGRMVLVTVDHGICIRPMSENSDPVETVRKVVAGGADAVLLTPGIARLAWRELAGTDTSLILRIDGTITSLGPDLTNDRLISSVETAARVGADAVATVGVIGVPREAELIEKIGRVAEDCQRWGMIQLTEMIPAEILEHQLKDRAERRWPSDAEVVSFSARTAAEAGADIVKGYYTGRPDSFRETVRYCPVPYVILSGPAAGDPQEFLRFVKEAVDCGARGISVGRNVWSHSNPQGMTRALGRIVHEGASVERAMEELR